MLLKICIAIDLPLTYHSSYTSKNSYYISLLTTITDLTNFLLEKCEINVVNKIKTILVFILAANRVLLRHCHISQLFKTYLHVRGRFMIMKLFLKLVKKNVSDNALHICSDGKQTKLSQPLPGPVLIIWGPYAN